MSRLLAVLVLLVLSVPALAQNPDTATDLSGLWKAKRVLGGFPDAHLMITRSRDGYRADMLGRTVSVTAEGSALAFTLPGGEGSFRGRVEKTGGITGHWFRPGTASPVTLAPDGSGRWTGTVSTPQDEYTFFLLLRPEGPNAWRAVLRNPERDFGTLWRVSKLVRDGRALTLMGQLGGKDAVISTGAFDPEREAITLVFASRGGSYDFTRDDGESGFYPRGEKPAPYAYAPPVALDDGWPVGSLEAESINHRAIEGLVQRLLETPMDSTDAPQYHAVLIARHGKLLLEEYFHGEHRDKLHNTRSAGKSITSVLVGTVMNDGAPLRLSSPVYQVMNHGAFPAGLDPQKRDMTLEHLLTMSSGYFCDDTNEQAPGHEDNMWETQDQHPDFWKFTLALPLATPPGEKSVYCSISPNLALGMVAHATHDFPLVSFDRLVAQPMKIRRYAWGLDGADNPYGGGGSAFVARDFLKFGQLMLNEGMWDGRRILSREFARASITPQYHLRRIGYGYLWWTEDLPYKNRTVHAFLALGAGGQYIVGVPELDLVVVLMSGNYASRVQGKLREIIPRFILPAVREPGDDPNAPVTEQAYTNPYGRSDDGSRIR